MSKVTDKIIPEVNEYSTQYSTLYCRHQVYSYRRQFSSDVTELYPLMQYRVN